MLGVDLDKIILLSTPFQSSQFWVHIFVVMLCLFCAGNKRCCIVLYRVVSCCIVLYRIVSYRVVSCRVVSCRIVSYCIVVVGSCGYHDTTAYDTSVCVTNALHLSCLQRQKIYTP